MTVRCTRCGEELLGAVNRCWKCGQQFAAQPTIDGLPPVRAEVVEAMAASDALEASILETPADAETPTAVLVTPPPAPRAPYAPVPPALPAHPLATPRPTRRGAPPPHNVAAVGGAYAALLVGLFALALSWWRYEAAIVALVGLLAGIWGIYSPRRGWALVGMLLCALAMGLGTYTGVRQLYLYLNRNAPIEVPLPEEEAAP